MHPRESSWFGPAFSLLGALGLAVMPLSAYWSLIAPRRYGLLTAFWMGLALDALSGSLLGQHSLALLVIVYLSQRFYLRIRVFPASQLAFTAIGLLGLYEFVLFWVDGVAGRTVPLIERWAPVASGGVLWLLILVFLERGRQEAEARM